MCEQATFVWVRRGPRYEKQAVACRKCEQCRNHRMNDLIGRSLAEAWASAWTLSFTLTYAPRSDLAEKIVTPRHFQDFIRSMRDRRHSLRYIGAGEYGELKGRAHFHAVLFGQGPEPDIALECNTHIEAWPHGHIFVERPKDWRAMRYVCKYALKEQQAAFNPAAQSWFTLSKKPPLGDAFFAALAERTVEMGTLPSTFRYIPPGGSDGFQCTMTGATRREFIRRIVAGYGERELRSRMSQWCAESYDKVLRWEHQRAVEETNRKLRWIPDWAKDQYMALLTERYLEDVHRTRKEDHVYVAPIYGGLYNVVDRYTVRRDELFVSQDAGHEVQQISPQGKAEFSRLDWLCLNPKYTGPGAGRVVSLASPVDGGWSQVHGRARDEPRPGYHPRTATAAAAGSGEAPARGAGGQHLGSEADRSGAPACECNDCRAARGLEPKAGVPRPVRRLPTGSRKRRR